MSNLVVLGSFLLAFKALLVEGSEVAILSVATVKQLGRDNVILGVATGAAVSAVVFAGVRQVFLFLPEAVVDTATGLVILYFSYRFLRGFRKYYFGKKSFRDKMMKMKEEVLEKDRERYGEDAPEVIPFSFVNSLPVFSITLTEGFEASLVLAAAGAFNLEWTLIGGAVAIALLLVVSALSYEYLLRFPRWALDLLAGVVLLSFGTYFLVTGILVAA
jgi:uncharacterized membrane protein